MKIEKEIKVAIEVNGKYCSKEPYCQFRTGSGLSRFCNLFNKIDTYGDYCHTTLKTTHDDGFQAVRCQPCLDEFGHTGEDK